MDYQAARSQIIECRRKKVTYLEMEHRYRVNRYYLWHVVNRPGYVPPDWVLERLGVRSHVERVVVVDGQNLAAGALTPGSQVCDCGRAFVSNHPRRRRCYVCSPMRGKGSNNGTA